jgi:hypothetical protein
LEEQIVFLDRFDEVASIRAKLDAVRGEYVGVVIPVENRSLHSSIAVRLVVRHADNSALRIGVISSDATVRRLFREEGIPVFRNVKAYRDYVARQSKRLTRVSSALRALHVRLDKTASLLVVVILFALVGATAYALVPSLTVYVSPVSEPVNDVLVIRADPSVKAIDTKSKLIPARAVAIQLESSIQVPTTGKKTLPNARAEGTVTVTNRTSSAITIPAGTILRTTENVRFVIGQEVLLAPGPSVGTKIDVIALEPGDQGNVDRGKINKFDGPLDQQISVFNEEPIAGGGSREVPVVLAEDKDLAREGLVDKMTKEAIKKLEDQRNRENESLPPHSVSFTVLEEVFDKKEGDQARVLNLKITGRASGTMFDGRDVNELVRLAWQPTIRSGYVVPPGAYNIYPPEVIKVESPAVTFVVKVEGITIAQINENRVRDNVRWRTESEARAYLLQTLNLSREPRVVFDPSWASRALRVRVVIEGDWARASAP